MKMAGSFLAVEATAYLKKVLSKKKKKKKMLDSELRAYRECVMAALIYLYPHLLPERI